MNMKTLRRLSSEYLHKRCPVKPTLPPPQFDWNRKWTQHIAGYSGMTVNRFIAYDDRRETFKTAPLDAKTVKAYVKAWDKARNLKPAMKFIKPTHGSWA